jgi:hypothetical protein
MSVVYLIRLDTVLSKKLCPSKDFKPSASPIELRERHLDKAMIDDQAASTLTRLSSDILPPKLVLKINFLLSRYINYAPNEVEALVIKFRIYLFCQQVRDRVNVALITRRHSIPDNSTITLG